MGMALDTIVPWGRSFEEYVAMFGLTNTDLTKRILGCGDGPAGFNAALTARGGTVVSLDPLYAFNKEQIRGRIAGTYQTVLDQVRANSHDYVWDVIPSIDALGHVRMSAMETFLADFEAGRRADRYIAGELPSLPFERGTFDIALSSHFLFLYSAHLSLEFHLQALNDMLRVAHEVRLFPLLTLDGFPSPHVPMVIERLSRQGHRAEIARVPYEFQRGGNAMLVVAPA
ncbi:conserved hypothetical protein [Nitrospira lenta]|uniref:SAM-dependent methyltransferase n=2 Tax=Nitrospira lenta TaxID=1436998 RepID=A0A330L806_9BACT|nr:conserved hypothetical protein [Nitrospira lenta]